MPLKIESVKTKLRRPILVLNGLAYERHVYNDLLSPLDRAASLSESQGLLSLRQPSWDSIQKSLKIGSEMEIFER